MDFTMREAHINDAELLGKMNLNLYTEGEHQREKSLEQLEERFRYYINDKRWNINIILLEGEENGYVLWRFEDDDVYVRHIWISDKFKGKGLSATILDELSENFWEGKRIRIQMFASNNRMREFWGFQGFKERSIIMERNS